MSVDSSIPHDRLLHAADALLAALERVDDASTGSPTDQRHPDVRSLDEFSVPEIREAKRFLVRCGVL